MNEVKSSLVKRVVYAFDMLLKIVRHLLYKILIWKEAVTQLEVQLCESAAAAVGRMGIVFPDLDPEGFGGPS